MKILCLMDSPLLATGFAKVGRNLATRWVRSGAVVDIWAIGFNGWGYKKWPHGTLYPATVRWASSDQLRIFLHLLASGYSHAFLLQDTFQFSREFCDAFKSTCRERGIKSMMYFPVDAPLDKEWVEILRSVDVPIAYTRYGAEMARVHGVECRTLPHGVDTEVFRPRPERRIEDRSVWKIGGKPFVNDQDWLLVNVNANQRRKDPAASLVVLERLRRLGVPAKLVMHCRGATPYGVDLEAVGRQLGLEFGQHWIHTGALFGLGDTTFLGLRDGEAVIGSAAEDADVARFYNAADCLLSTSLGEGWGLSFTEALACGCPAAVPAHTALREIGEHDAFAGRVRLLPVEPVVLSDEMSRLRFRVRVDEAARSIAEFRQTLDASRPPLEHRVAAWLCWDRIASQMLRWME